MAKRATARAFSPPVGREESVSGSGGTADGEDDAAVAWGGEDADVVAARSSPPNVDVAVAVLVAALGTGRATTLSVLFARSRAAAVFSTAPRSSSYFVCSAFNGGRGKGAQCNVREDEEVRGGAVLCGRQCEGRGKSVREKRVKPGGGVEAHWYAGT